MAHPLEDSVMPQLLQLIDEHGLDSMRDVMQTVLNHAMLLEREQALGVAPYQRSPERLGHANGFKPKTVAARVGPLQLAIPQVRGGVSFYPSALERGLRSERALKTAVAEMYVQGVSTGRVTKVMRELCGLDISSSQVSRAVQALDVELAPWRTRPLGAIPFLLLDARYEPVRIAGTVVQAAVLIAVGILPSGTRSVLGVSVSLSEAELHWREFLQQLQARGLHGLCLIASDAHAGLRDALRTCFPTVPWQRCQCHLQRNAQEHCPKVAWRAPLAAALRDVFQAPKRKDADERLAALVAHYRPTAPKLADWLEANIPDGLTVFLRPPHQRVRLRTTNAVENLNKQVKRRTRLARPFGNEAGALRLVSAVLMEISDDWETGKVYLNPTETDDAPPVQP